MLIHPLLQLTVLAETLQNEIVKFALLKVSNIKHL